MDIKDDADGKKCQTRLENTNNTGAIFANSQHHKAALAQGPPQTNPTLPVSDAAARECQDITDDADGKKCSKRLGDRKNITDAAPVLTPTPFVVTA